MKPDTSRVPMGAIVLILLGVLFLLHTAGLFEYGFDRYWPVLLIILGGWLFARNYGLVGTGGVADPATCKRRLMGPVMLLTIGVLLLLQSTGVAGFHRTWPVILLVVGGIKLLQGAGSGMDAGGPHPGGGVIPSGGPPPPPAPPPPAPPAPPSEVNRG